MEPRNLDDIYRARGDIIDGISDHIMLLDTRSYEIVEVNRAFLRSYGLVREEVVGRPCYEVTHQIDRKCHEHGSNLRCPIVESLNHDGPIRLDHIHHDSLGNEKLIEIAAFPIRDDAGEVVRLIHLSQDVTDKKRARHTELEKERLRVMVELAGATSHEINQPLTTLLIGLGELVKRSKPGSREHMLLQTALADAERLLETSRKLSRLTRYETTGYVGRRQIIDLNRSSRPSNPIE